MFVIRRVSDGQFVMDLPAKYGRTYTRDLDYARWYRSLEGARADAYDEGREHIVCVQDLERRL